MKNYKRLLLILILTIILLPVKANASGWLSVSPSSISLEEGQSASFTITAYNTIADVSISTSNGSVASISTTSWGTGMVGEGETRSCTVTVTGISEGTASINVYIADGATFDSPPINLAGQSRTVSVSVRRKPNTVVVPSDNNNNNNNNNNTNNTTKPDQKTETTEKSKNTKLKELKVDIGKLVKVDDNNYTLELPNNAEEITITATPEDSKSKVIGAGKHKTKIGENVIELTVTSESGDTNKITIKAIRKDAYYLEDIDTVLSTSTDKQITFKIKDNSVLTVEYLNKIKESKKTIILDYYDNNNKLIYSWTIDGSKIDNVEEMSTIVKFESQYQEEIKALDNNGTGMYLTFANEGKFPTGTKIRIYVGTKFKDSDKIDIYYYDKDNNKLTLVKSKAKVSSGYIEFDVEKGSYYYLKKVKEEVKKEEVKEEDNSNLTIISIAFFAFSFICFIGSVIYYVKKTKKKKEEII